MSTYLDGTAVPPVAPQEDDEAEEETSTIDGGVTWTTNPPSSPPPSNNKDGIGQSTFAQYRTVLRNVFKKQVARRVNASSWEHIWTEPCDNLFSLVKKCKPMLEESRGMKYGLIFIPGDNQTDKMK